MNTLRDDNVFIPQPDRTVCGKNDIEMEGHEGRGLTEQPIMFVNIRSAINSALVPGQ